MAIPLATQPLSRSFFEPSGQTLVTWLGMAGVAINTRGTVLLVDPLISVIQTDEGRLSESGHRFKAAPPIEANDVPRVDAVLITHADDDHCGQGTALTLHRRLGPRFVCPPPVAAKLEAAGVSRERITIVRDFDTLRVGAAEIHVTPALHDYEQEKPFRRGDCVGFLLRTDDGAIWHPGDTRLIPELLEVRDVSMLFFDVANVDSHLGGEGSAAIARSAGATVLVAYHYGTFDLPPGGWGSCDPSDSLPFVKDLPARFITPNPGEILRLPVEP